MRDGERRIVGAKSMDTLVGAKRGRKPSCLPDKLVLHRNIIVMRHHIWKSTLPDHLTQHDLLGSIMKE